LKNRKHSIIILSSILILLILIFGTSLLLSRYINSEVKILTIFLQNISEDVKTGDYDSAKEKYDEFYSKWNSTEKKWNSYLNHSKISEIDISAEKLSNQIDIKNGQDAVIECGLLIHLFKNISTLDKISFENIF
jgi:hypothetical protein